MLGEEIGLPHALESAGIERVETDLAEHIVQLARRYARRTSFGPSMHNTREQVAALVQSAARATAPASDDIEAMVDERAA